jgi:hypothetical protein
MYSTEANNQHLVGNRKSLQNLLQPVLRSMLKQDKTIKKYLHAVVHIY